tara:strand:- start:265 stop:1047 length:783 start_codon:yes stop_codon:yes gene_type:complete
MNEEKIIKNLKKLILHASFNAQEGHIPSAFSILDILYVLYDKVLNINFSNLKDISRDYFILSKGHASLAHSAILFHKKLIKESDMLNYCSFDGILGGHLDRLKVPGVEISSGSLGHGVSVSIGISLASRIRKINNKVICLCGDGEANEGTFWESMLLSTNLKLSNLCFILDYNHSNDRSIKLEPLYDKFISFGLNVIVIDGHNHEQIYNSLNSLNLKKPNVIIANTIKGKGIKIMENNPEWHHKFPKKEELNQLLIDLDS